MYLDFHKAFDKVPHIKLMFSQQTWIAGVMILDHFRAMREIWAGAYHMVGRAVGVGGQDDRQCSLRPSRMQMAGSVSHGLIMGLASGRSPRKSAQLNLQLSKL